MKHESEGEYELDTQHIDVNSMQTLIKLTPDSVGYAVLPEPEVRHLLKSGEMKQLFTDWELSDYTVYAVTPKRELMQNQRSNYISARFICANLSLNSAQEPHRT